MNSSNLEVVSGNTLTIFIKYASLNVLSLIAMTSSGFVDAYFVSNYVGGGGKDGELGLASINIFLPVFSLIFAFSIMLTIGSAVRAGKYIGENKGYEANQTFTSSIVLISVLMIIFSALCVIFNESVARFLGSSDLLLPYVTTYLTTFMPFVISPALNYAFTVYARVDGKPFLAVSAIVASFVINIVLNYLFIIEFDMGLRGAALATGLSTVPSTLFLFFYFLSKYSTISFVLKFESLKKLALSTYNGLSEFISESSLGLVTFIFNIIMMKFAKEAGVSAFTTINYLTWAAGMIAYGIGDALVPLISINLGSNKLKRIRKFLIYAIVSSLAVGFIIFTSTIFYGGDMVAVFLKDRTSEAFMVSMEFMKYVRWSFLFIAPAIILSAYFTAMQKPTLSLIIALSRGAILPIFFVLLLPLFLGDVGVYLSLTVANILGTIFAIYLFVLNRKHSSKIKCVE